MRVIFIIVWFVIVNESVYSGEGVVLLHGLARTSKSMEKMESALSREGYQVLNIDYPSRSDTIERLATGLRLQIVEGTANWDRIHFVTHSMGGILVREMQTSNPLENVGRVVMLAPPNQGSEVVDRLGSNYLFKKLNGPAGEMLGTSPDGYLAMLGPVDFELGVIAGDRSINLILSQMIPGPNDGKVSVERTKLQGMVDFRVVHASHPFIMQNNDVVKATIRFIENGCFD